MRRALFVLLAMTTPMLSGCQSPPAENYASDDANEDAALNTIREQDNEAQGAGAAVSGMIPDEHGQLPMANVQ